MDCRKCKKLYANGGDCNGCLIEHTDSKLVSSEVTLNVKQIFDLAEFAGIPVDRSNYDKDSLDTPIVIAECPEISWEDEPEARYEYMAYFEEYPNEGQMPLGDKTT